MSTNQKSGKSARKQKNRVNAKNTQRPAAGTAPASDRGVSSDNFMNRNRDGAAHVRDDATRGADSRFAGGEQAQAGAARGTEQAPERARKARKG